VPQLLSERDLFREHAFRQQTLDQVVVAATAFSPHEAEHTGGRVGLQHGAYRVRRKAEPVRARARPPFEVVHRQCALLSDAREHELGDFRMRTDVLCRPLAEDAAEPGELVDRYERQPLVVGLEDLASVVQLVAPRRVVVCNASVQDEVVRAARDRDRVVLNRAQPPDDLHDGFRAAGKRARRREKVPRDEKAARLVGGDLHSRDANEAPRELMRKR
jgi:hypothetical protein